MTNRSLQQRRLASQLYDEASRQLAIGNCADAYHKFGRVLDLAPDFPGARHKCDAIERQQHFEAQYHAAIQLALSGRFREALRAFSVIDPVSVYHAPSLHWARVGRRELAHQGKQAQRAPSIPVTRATLLATPTVIVAICMILWMGTNALMAPLPGASPTPPHRVEGESTVLPSNTAFVHEADPAEAPDDQAPIEEPDDMAATPAGTAPGEPGSTPGAPTATLAPGAPTRTPAPTRRPTTTPTRVVVQFVPTRTPTAVRPPTATSTAVLPPPTASATPAPSTPTIVAPTPAATSTPLPTATVGIVIAANPSQTPAPSNTPVPTSTPAPVTIVVHAYEYDFSPAEISVTAGARVRLTLVNDGDTTFDWVLLNPNGTIAAKVMAGAGQTVTGQFTAPTAPGAYSVVCDISNYAQLGMKGVVNVTAR
ncbi:MAG: cupredoxin domain-containing protein [Chloroflexi bacterium]|nr:cupredoxin domain-containing protein [Chloroflexota bacterium]